MVNKHYPRFHGIQKSFVVIVAEGNGTEESIIREVKYVFDENFQPIGKIDPHPEENNDN